MKQKLKIVTVRNIDKNEVAYTSLPQERSGCTMGLKRGLQQNLQSQYRETLALACPSNMELLFRREICQKISHSGRFPA